MHMIPGFPQLCIHPIESKVPKRALHDPAEKLTIEESVRVDLIYSNVDE